MSRRLGYSTDVFVTGDLTQYNSLCESKTAEGYLRGPSCSKLAAVIVLFAVEDNFGGQRETSEHAGQGIAVAGASLT